MQIFQHAKSLKGKFLDSLFWVGEYINHSFEATFMDNNYLLRKKPLFLFIKIWVLGDSIRFRLNRQLLVCNGMLHDSLLHKGRNAVYMTP